jgi:hypothetical protein
MELIEVENVRDAPPPQSMDWVLKTGRLGRMTMNFCALTLATAMMATRMVEVNCILKVDWGELKNYKEG